MLKDVHQWVLRVRCQYFHIRSRLRLLSKIVLVTTPRWGEEIVFIPHPSFPRLHYPSTCCADFLWRPSLLWFGRTPLEPGTGLASQLCIISNRDDLLW